MALLAQGRRERQSGRPLNKPPCAVAEHLVDTCFTDVTFIRNHFRASSLSWVSEVVWRSATRVPPARRGSGSGVEVVAVIRVRLPACLVPTFTFLSAGT